MAYLSVTGYQTITEDFSAEEIYDKLDSSERQKMLGLILGAERVATLSLLQAQLLEPILEAQSNLDPNLEELHKEIKDALYPAPRA